MVAVRWGGWGAVAGWIGLQAWLVATVLVSSSVLLLWGELCVQPPFQESTSHSSARGRRGVLPLGWRGGNCFQMLSRQERR